MEYEIDLNIELHFPEIDANMETEVEEEILIQEKLLRFNDLIMSKLK